MTEGSENTAATFFADDRATPAASEVLDIIEARAALEALLIVMDSPLDPTVAAGPLGWSVDDVAKLLSELARDYESGGRGFRLREIAGGWRLYAAPQFAELVKEVVLDEQPVKLTQAALETLAIVAYQQPVSRSRVGAIRGVSVDAVMRTLVSRGLVDEAGSDESSGAVLYGTTALFLERLGLAGIHELPDLAPMLPEVKGIQLLDGEGSGTDGDF